MNRNRKDIFLVSIQFALFIVYCFRISSIDFKFNLWMQIIGLFFSISGIIIIGTAIITLNKNLSPFPTPKATAQLIQYGIYKYIRHPIYTGILSFTLGYGFYTDNSLRIIVGIALAILFKFKATYEEHLLQQKFSTYSNYQKSSGMFLPFL